MCQDRQQYQCLLIMNFHKSPMPRHSNYFIEILNPLLSKPLYKLLLLWLSDICYRCCGSTCHRLQRWWLRWGNFWTTIILLNSQEININHLFDYSFYSFIQTYQHLWIRVFHWCVYIFCKENPSCFWLHDFTHFTKDHGAAKSYHEIRILTQVSELFNQLHYDWFIIARIFRLFLDRL